MIRDASRILPAARRSGPARSRGRILAEAAAILVLTLLCTAGLLEITLRLFLPLSAPGLEGNDPYTGLFSPDAPAAYRNAPNAQVAHRTTEFNVVYSTDARGLRAAGRSAPSPGPLAPGTTRLLVLGDSFTFGWGVPADAAFPSLLNGALAADGSRIESLNAGVMGYGTDNELAWLDAYGWALAPRIVLVGFYTGNDVTDVMAGLHKSEVNAGGRLVARIGPDAVPAEPAAGGGLGGVQAWLGRHSYAYVFLRALAHHLNGTAPDEQRLQGMGEATLLRREEPPAVAAGWAKTLGLLDQIRAGAQAHGATLVVVALPMERQIDDAAWASVPGLLGLPAAAFERDHPQQRLAAWSARTGTPLVDLLPGFRSAAPPGPALYYRIDPHWTPAGHALAARLIQEGLVRLGLVRP